MYDSIKKIYDLWRDELSKQIFIQRINGYLTSDMDLLSKLGSLCVYYKEDEAHIVRSFANQMSSCCNVTICGGKYSDYVLKHLELYFNSQFTIRGIDKQAGTVDFGNGLEYHTYVDYFSQYGDNDTIFLVTPPISHTCEVIAEELSSFGVPRERIIFFYEYYKIYSKMEEMQYFDFFLPQPDEVFVDGGAYDGLTSIRFVNWSRGNYKKIIAFEPGNTQYIKAQRTLSNLKGVELHNAGLWEKDDTLTFSDTGDWIRSPGFSIEKRNRDFREEMSEVKKELQTVSIPVRSLDSVLGGERVSYIKLDVEGSELMALKGATRTIMRHKPRLAISVYHRKEDIIEIPSLLLEINPNYHFALRHYSSFSDETVLYAFEKDVRRYQ